MENVLGKRIELERTRLGLNQIELAKKLNLSSSASISQYESGDRMPSDDIKLKMAEIFDCSVDYLLGKTDSRKTASSSPVVVFVYGKIPAGIPMEMIEDIIDTEEISSDWLKGDKQYFGLKVNGNSMMPKYQNNDTIICLKCEDCESGDDCIVAVNGNDATFKKVIKNENGIILQPLNPEFSPLVYTNEDIKKLPVRILGKVVELRRKI